MKNNPIRIGGVPEHFNLPIHLANEKKAFEKRGVDVEWITYSGGTGQMTKALRDDDVDLCVLLTEGIIADIVKGNKSKLVSVYVTTPLIWGIHTGYNNSLKSYNDIYDKTYAISRYGSGSHLMAIVDANSKDQQLSNEQFNVIKNLDGALESLQNNTSDVFYWEKYTTKPFVDNGQLRRVGEYLTPWPCFVIAASDKVLKEQPENVIRVLRTIHDACDAFMQNENAIQLVADRYQQKEKDVERWFHSTEWAIHGWISNKMIDSIIYHLKLAKIIDDNADIPQLIWNRNE